MTELIDSALLRTHISYCCAMVTSMLTLGLCMLSHCLAQLTKKAEKDVYDLKFAQKCCRSKKQLRCPKKPGFVSAGGEKPLLSDMTRAR